MNFFTIALFVFSVVFCTSNVGATMCKPLSKFTVDCDECQCSEDGTEYSCTVRDCRPSANGKGGYGLGSSRSRLRDTDVAVPYLNDEIPPSRESSEEINSDYSADYNDSEDADSGFQDVRRKEQDASVMDTGLPDDYRLRRFIRPGK